MAGVITTGLHPKSLQPGVLNWFGLGYGEHPEQFRDLFQVINKPGRMFLEDVLSSAFTTLPVKPQGQPVSYMTHSQVYTARYTFVTYAGGFQVTEEEMDANLYPELSASRAEMLGRAKRRTMETVAANVYNRAFNTSYTGGDGVVLVATTHPSAVGNQSNILNPAADISEAALEDLITQTMKTQDHVGNIIQQMPYSLHVPPDLYFEATRIMESQLQNWTANNAVNVLKLTGQLPGGVKVQQYFTDADAFFIRTDCPNGMKMFISWDKPLEMDKDFDTSNAKQKCSVRLIPYWSDWRQVAGSPGA